jgi:YggT family protein
MQALLILIDSVVHIYILMLIVSAVLSWLLVFGVINRYNRAVVVISDTLERLTEPVLRPIRRVLPHLGGIDVSPVIAILLLIFIRNLLFEIFARYAASY